MAKTIRYHDDFFRTKFKVKKTMKDIPAIEIMKSAYEKVTDSNRSNHVKLKNLKNASLGLTGDQYKLTINPGAETPVQVPEGRVVFAFGVDLGKGYAELIKDKRHEYVEMIGFIKEMVTEASKLAFRGQRGNAKVENPFEDSSRNYFNEVRVGMTDHRSRHQKKKGKPLTKATLYLELPEYTLTAEDEHLSPDVQQRKIETFREKMINTYAILFDGLSRENLVSEKLAPKEKLDYQVVAPAY